MPNQIMLYDILLQNATTSVLMRNKKTIGFPLPKIFCWWPHFSLYFIIIFLCFIIGVNNHFLSSNLNLLPNNVDGCKHEELTHSTQLSESSRSCLFEWEDKDPFYKKDFWSIVTQGIYGHKLCP